MVKLIPYVKMNEPSLLTVHLEADVDTILISIQDLISPITCNSNKTFNEIERAGGGGGALFFKF